MHNIVSPLNVTKQQTHQEIREQAQEMTICAQPELPTLVAVPDVDKATKHVNLFKKAAGTGDVSNSIAKIEPGAGGGPTRLKPI